MNTSGNVSKTFNSRQILMVFTGNVPSSTAEIYRQINKLIKSGEITRIERNSYALVCNSVHHLLSGIPPKRQYSEIYDTGIQWLYSYCSDFRADYHHRYRCYGLYECRPNHRTNLSCYLYRRSICNYIDFAGTAKLISGI